MPKVTGAAWPAGTPPEAQPGGWRGPHCPCWNVPVVSSSWVWGPDPVRLQLHCPPPRPRAQHPRGPTEDPLRPGPSQGLGKPSPTQCAPHPAHSQGTPRRQREPGACLPVQLNLGTFLEHP